MSDPFEPIAGGGNSRKGAPPKLGVIEGGASSKPWTIVTPVPGEILDYRPTSHRQYGKPSATWTYRDAAGAVLGFVHRFDEADGGKRFQPQCAARYPDGKLDWKWRTWENPRPLYGLDRLALRPTATVIVTEGEKSADAAEQLLPEIVAVTSPNGALAAKHADWRALAGRDVVIWPDADKAGASYAAEVEKLLGEIGAGGVRCIDPPAGSAEGWDAADALKEGWTAARAAALVGAAKGAAKPDPAAKRGPTQRDQLLAVADEFELWHTRENVCFATVPVKEHREHWRIDSAAFKRIWAGRYYRATGRAPASQQLAEGLRVLELRAIEEGPCLPAFCRVGHLGSEVWIDLCDATWRAVRVTATGFTVVDEPPVRFQRTETMQALPEPEDGDKIEALRGFINADEDDFKLIVGWLVAALWGRGTTYPVLAVGGEQGSGKSTVAKLLRNIVDPSAVPSYAPPKEERDLFTMATNGHVLSFDNVSKIDAWFSDAICRISTGSGFLTRKLHTDFEASWFHGSRPSILNGIPTLTERADLAERSLTIRLNRIGSDTRATEAEWWELWREAHPRVFGALLNALAGAIRRFPDVRLSSKPRMADFAHLMAAAESSLGWEPGAFEAAYTANRHASDDAVFESDPVAVAIDKLIRNRQAGRSWEGTATMLLGELNELVPEDVRRSRFWPGKPNALGNAVDRAAPLLRQRGIDVRKHNTGTQRLIMLTPTGGEATDERDE